MRRDFVAVLLSGCLLVGSGLGGRVAWASPDENPSQEKGTAELIAFRLPVWKTLHFSDAAKANQHASTLRRLGCEVKEAEHDGHTDVSYRCLQWETLPVSTTKEGEAWGRWLGQAGFDVSLTEVDAAYLVGDKSVSFELREWKTIHGKGGDGDRRLIDQLKKMGCEVRVSNHGNHLDIRYRSPVRRTLRFNEETHAAQYTAWLQGRGFEAEHLR